MTIAHCFKSWLLARVLDQKVVSRACFGSSRWVSCIDVAQKRPPRREGRGGRGEQDLREFGVPGEGIQGRGTQFTS